MTAHVKVMKVEIATGYPALSYLVELEGDGRGLFAAASSTEAVEVASRINDFPAMADKLLYQEKTITRLKKQLRKLRQAQKKGGMK